MVYRLGSVDGAREAVRRWRQRALSDGLGGLHVLAVTPSRDFEGLPTDVADIVDGLVRFPPGSGIGLQSVGHLAPGLVSGHSGDIYSYDAAVDGADLRPVGAQGLRVHPGVMPGWDNTARRGDAAYVFHGANPLSFRRWLSRAAAAVQTETRLCSSTRGTSGPKGAALEADGRFARGHLRTVTDVISSRV